MFIGHIPRFGRNQLDSCPKAGSGVHFWLFSTARVLHRFFPNKAELASLLKKASADCGRVVPEIEIAEAIRNSEACAWHPGQGGWAFPGNGSTSKPRYHKWPVHDMERIEEIVTNGPGLGDLWSESPIRFEDNGRHTEEIIDDLFPGNPLLCAGRTNSVFDTRPCDDWDGTLREMAFIVPSPMSARSGLTKEGEPSAHTLANTGPRRFLVIECDFSVYARDGKTETEFAPLIRRMADLGRDTLDMGAAILFHLAPIAPLSVAVSSGGKSLHGWFFCAGQTESRLEKFMQYAVSIGADKATWSRCQFVRIPDGTRENGKRQAVYFFNPGVVHD